MTKRKTVIGQMKECVRPDCETQIHATPNRLYCEACKKVIRSEYMKSHSSLLNEQRNARGKKARAVIVPRKILITNADQAALNRSVDNKHSVDQRVKRYFHCEVKFAELQRYYGG